MKGEAVLSGSLYPGRREPAREEVMVVAGSISGLRRQIPDFLLFSSGRQINLGEWAEFGDPHSSEENGKNGTTAVKKAVQNNEAAHKGGTGEPNKAVLAEIGRMLDRLIGLEGQQIM